MTRMGTRQKDHGSTGARLAVAPPRSAWVSAWTVAVCMAGTSSGFQVYHALKWGRQPWGAAYPEGIAPLVVSLAILQVISKWRGVPEWCRWGAYAVLVGAMYMSASATGAVVAPISPPHMSLLFGLLMDGAAIIAFHFILNAPRAADVQAAAEEAAADRAQADDRARLQAEADRAQAARAEDAARAQEELNAARADAQAIDAARAEAERHGAAAGAEAQRLAVLLRAGDEAVAGVRAELEAAASAVRESAEARAAAEKRAASAEARAARATRKEEGGARAGTARKDAGARAQDRAPSDEAEAEADVDARTKALGILEKNPGISAAQLGVDAGMSKRWGQDHKAEFVAMLAELGEEAPEPAAGPEDAQQ